MLSCILNLCLYSSKQSPSSVRCGAIPSAMLVALQSETVFIRQRQNGVSKWKAMCDKMLNKCDNTRKCNDNCNELSGGGPWIPTNIQNRPISDNLQWKGEQFCWRLLDTGARATPPPFRAVSGNLDFNYLTSFQMWQHRQMHYCHTVISPHTSSLEHKVCHPLLCGNSDLPFPLWSILSTRKTTSFAKSRYHVVARWFEDSFFSF